MPRKPYGGSYTSRGSHNDTRLPVNKSARTPKDLGVLGGGTTTLEGLIGSQSGAATLFYEFRTEQGLRIQLLPEELNSFASPKIQWSLSRIDGVGDMMREPLQLFTRNQSGSDTEGYLISPGAFRITVSTASWYELPFRAQLLLREPPLQGGALSLTLEFEFRLNLAEPLPGEGVEAAVGGDLPLELDISARLMETIDMPGAAYFGYTTPNYWVDGYATGDGQVVGSQLDVPALELEIIASLSVSSPSNL